MSISLLLVWHEMYIIYSDKTVLNNAFYRIKPHHSQDPDCEAKIHHQNDDEKQDKQIKATFPPAIYANGIDGVSHWCWRTRLICGADVLFTNHLQRNINVKKN